MRHWSTALEQVAENRAEEDLLLAHLVASVASASASARVLEEDLVVELPLEEARRKELLQEGGRWELSLRRRALREPPRTLALLQEVVRCLR